VKQAGHDFLNLLMLPLRIDTASSDAGRERTFLDEFRSSERKKFADITAADSGAGITKGELPPIFERFRRGEAAVLPKVLRTDT
jgi:signal transduction histidine kinase